MSCLPAHGRVTCNRCYSVKPTQFDQSKEERDSWRITSNPLAWGNSTPEIVVLGFSKGPTQAGALASTHHDDIAYKGSRLNVGKILAHVGLLSENTSEALKNRVDYLISDKNGIFHFGSLIRCTVERFDAKEKKWKGSGGGMLDKFVATSFGRLVATNCTQEHLSSFPDSTKLVIMFGLGTKKNYVKEAFKLFQKTSSGNWTWLNDVAYTDGKITVVHVEHFASQGALIPNWLGENQHERSKLGVMAKTAVQNALYG